MHRSLTEYELAAQEAFSERDACEDVTLQALGPRLLGEFSDAVEQRRTTEERWLGDLRQYRGIYDPEVLAAIGPVRSKAFVRKTRVKVKTIDSRVADLLFPAGTEKNWTVGPTPRPSVSREQKDLIIAGLQQMQQQAAQAQQAGAQVPAGAAQIAPDAVDQAVREFCASAAEKMSAAIEDQLVETRYKDACLRAVHSGHLYGTGVIKGPLVERKTRTRFVQQGDKWVARSEDYVVPFVDFVPLWRWYPDMAATQLEDCRYVWERHQMTQSALAELAERKSFRKHRARIVDYIKSNPDGQTVERTVDQELRSIGDRDSMQSDVHGRYEVLERWGWLRGSELAESGAKVPEDRMHESFFSNVWILPNGQLIKAVLQPINGVTWPYHLYSFDDDETSIFSEGIAAIMRDDQTNLNAAVRMMLDNGALTSGPMVEVTPGLLSSFDKVNEIAPWKIWMRNAASPGTPAIRAIELPNHLAELRGLAQMFETNADETTAIPRYMTGENATQGAAGTASGMSMLMGAANIVIKDLVTAWDEGVTRTFLQSLYRWNMQFNEDASLKGDFDVKARGTASLIAKEVRARQLMEFTMSVSNPMDAPYIKRDKLLLQRAETNELADVVKTQEEVEAEMSQGPAAQQMQMQMQMQQLQMQAEEAKLAKLQAEGALIAANTALAAARATGLRLESVYAALQAAGVAVSTPGVAPVADEILRSADWQDATPGQNLEQSMGGEPAMAVNGVIAPGSVDGSAPAQPAAPMPASPAEAVQPATGQIGQQAGIQTAALGLGQ